MLSACMVIFPQAKKNKKDLQEKYKLFKLDSLNIYRWHTPPGNKMPEYTPPPNFHYKMKYYYPPDSIDYKMNYFRVFTPGERILKSYPKKKK